MDLSLFLDPISNDIHRLTIEEPNFGQSIYTYFEQIPDLEGIHIALIGINETRGSERNASGLGEAADAIRQKLYSLQKGAGGYRIADLGNLRNGPTLEDTYLRVKEVCTMLLEQEVLPVLIGGTHDMLIGQYQSYENLERMVNLMVVDNAINIGEANEASVSHLDTIIKYDPNYLFQLLHLGHQSFLVGEEKFALMESLYFEAIRIGMVKEKLEEMEPLIRDADLLSFDVSAINQQFAPGANHAGPYGLSGEEACQLCWYAGLNDKLTSIGFHEYDVDRDDERRTTAFVIATMIWYFIEGYYNRVEDKLFQLENYMIYEVDLGGEPASIRFFKSKRSEKWWMEVPDASNEKSVFLKSKMIPCSYADYESATKGEIPSRWLAAYARLG